MSDYDESVVIQETPNRYDCEEEEDEDEYYYRHKRHKRCYDCYNFECKKCKVDDSYEFVSIDPVILTNVPKLLEMASVAVAAALWNHVNIPEAVYGVNQRCVKDTKEWSALRKKVIESVEKLHLPKPNTEQISNYVRKMANEITAWVSYHYRTVFLKNGLDKFVYSFVCRIVWNHNGTINCVKTAKNMRPSLRLSEVEKLRFLAVYCLKDEMDQMSPLLYSNDVIDHTICYQNPMIYYWCRYFRNELHKIPTTSEDNPTLSLDVNMFRNSKVDNWSSKQYFLNRLSSEEQVQQAIWLIYAYGSVYQKAVMLELDETQRLQVYMKLATNIILNYTRPRVSSRFILLTWFEARHLFSPDQFSILFCDLLKAKINDTVLTEIWTSAADDFKQHAVSFNDHDILKRILSREKCQDRDFIFVLLQNSSATVRNAIMTEIFFNVHLGELLMNSRFHGFNRLLEFCLPNTEESTQFKINFVNNSQHVRHICLQFYSTGDSNGLNDFLKQLLAPYPDIIVEYKKNLLTSVYGVNQCVKVMDREVDVLNTIFEVSLPNASSITEFKRSMIFSPTSITKLKDSIIKKRVNAVQMCINRFLTSDEDKNALKKKLIGDTMEPTLMQAILQNNDASYLQAVMMWCFGNEDAIKEFKNSLNVELIFIIMLKDCVFCQYDRYLTRCEFKSCKLSDFDVIERFLTWYFESSIEVKKYKVKIINAYHRIDIFGTFLRGNRGDPQLRTMLEWFFKNDPEERAKFKMRGGKMTRLL
ncbi:uncharacterized protein LOC135848823 isoform X2 [Planococcus citri]